MDCIEAVLEDDEGGFYEWIDDCFPASRILDDLKYNEAAEVIDSYRHEYLRDTLSKGIDLETYGVEIVKDGGSKNRKPASRPRTAAKRKAPARRKTASKNSSGHGGTMKKNASAKRKTTGARR